MIYNYIKINAPDLDNYELAILNSVLNSTYIYLRWDEKNFNLIVNLNRELTPEEKIILDNLVQ